MKFKGKPAVELDVTVISDRMSIGGSIKLTSKMEASDTFVSSESSCSLSSTFPKGKLEETKERNSAFVRKTILSNLNKQIRMIRKAIEG